jgi:type I restriction enzyme S subunit
MSFPRYPAYKPSGVEWLGEVPEHWASRRLGFFFAERREKVSDKNFEALSVTKDGIVPQLDTAAKTDDGDNRKCVRTGDFVINSRSDRKGSSGLSRLDGSVSLICTVLRPQESVQGGFIHHLLRSVSFQEEFYRFGKGIVADLWSTNYSAMSGITLAMPPLEEQESIAIFLDHETAKIDALIAEQQRLIELLQEKRQAVISHAVTKGLNPHAPMKDSGVEWLGEVPEHWDVCRVKAVSVFTTSGPRGWSERVGDVGALFVQSGDLTDAMDVDFANCKRVQVGDDAEAARTKLLDGDLVVCITGAKTGNVAVCESVPESSYVNQHLCLIRPGEGVHPRFLAALLKSGCGQTYFSLAQYGLKQGLSLEDVREAPVALPTLDEQDYICQWLRGVSSRYLPLEAESQRTISLLQERRSALISAAVTGQIDVRGLVPQASTA